MPVTNIPYPETEIIREEDTGKAARMVYTSGLLIGILASSLSLVSPRLALHFNVDMSSVACRDIMGVIGSASGNFLSGIVISRFGAKKTLLFGYSTFAVAEICIGLQNNLSLYGLFVLCAGFFFGMIGPSNCFILVNAFRRYNKSEAKLAMLNFFNGTGGFVGPLIGGLIISCLSWRFCYLFTTIMALTLFYIVYSSKFRIGKSCVRKKAAADQSRSSHSIFNKGTLYIAAGLILYVYAEYIVSYWFSPYFQLELGYKVERVGLLIGIFWFSMAAGRLVCGKFILSRVKSYHFIIASSVIVFIGFIMIINASTFSAVIISTMVIGIGGAGIYPAMLGYGILLNYGSSFATSLLIFCGTVGAGMSMLLSSTIGHFLTKKDAIYLGPLCCVMICVFVILARKYEMKRGKAAK